MTDVLLHVGFGNVVAFSRVYAIVSPDSAPVRRMMKHAAEQNTVIDATCGHKTKAVIVLDTGWVALSALTPQTLAKRVRNPREPQHDEEDIEEA